MQVCKSCFKEGDETWPPMELELDPVNPECEICGKSEECYRVTSRDGKRVKFDYPTNCVCGLIHMPPGCWEPFHAVKGKFHPGHEGGSMSCCSDAWFVQRKDKGPGLGIAGGKDEIERICHCMSEAYYIGLQNRVLKNGESFSNCNL